ncbi:MAG: 2OG-Fe(II) oxygenase [Pseudomonadota bacterium]
MDEPTSRMLHANPLVAVVDGFLPAASCSELIALAQGRTRRAEAGTDEAVLEISDERTNSAFDVAPSAEPAVAAVMQRLAQVLRLPMGHGEGLSILHYRPGEEFTPHVDGIWSGAAEEVRAAFEADGGQRLFTAMVYLNAVEAGGGTAFPELDLSVDPAPGRLLIFANTQAGERDVTPLSIHAGLPVHAGEKWAAVSWWRERPFGVAA